MSTHFAAQVDYWNSVASEKTFSHPVRLDWLSRLPGGPSARVLDYGCGYGRTLRELSEAGFASLVGIDFSAAMLVRCRAFLPAVSLIRSDGQTLPLANGTVDIVLLFAVLTCIPADSDQRRLIAEVSRVLRPGGLVYVSDLLLNDDARNRARYEQYADQFDCYGVFQLPEGVVVRHHRKDWIEELTGSFQQLEFDPFEVITMNGNKSAAFQYLGKKTD